MSREACLSQAEAFDPFAPGTATWEPWSFSTSSPLSLSLSEDDRLTGLSIVLLPALA